MIDLHTHTTASDGTFTPTELVAQAAKNNVTNLAITDHDTVAGIEEGLEAGSKYGVTVIPGIEISTRYQDEEIHIIGLNIDYKNEHLLKELSSIKEDRESRNDRMVERLQELGYEITLDDVLAITGGDILTRAHFARVLVRKGYFQTIREVFEKLLHAKGPGYVKRKTLSSPEAVELIKNAGGKAILAHPLLYGLEKDKLEDLIKDLKEAGLDGIEAYYASFTPDQMSYIENLATTHQLKLSGGSDFHGDNRPGVDVGIGHGELNISPSILEALDIL